MDRRTRGYGASPKKGARESGRKRIREMRKRVRGKRKRKRKEEDDGADRWARARIRSLTGGPSRKGIVERR